MRHVLSFLSFVSAGLGGALLGQIIRMHFGERDAGIVLGAVFLVWIGVILNRMEHAWGRP